MQAPPSLLPFHISCWCNIISQGERNGQHAAPGRILRADNSDDRLLKSSPLPEKPHINPRHGVEVESEDRLAMAEALRVPGHCHLAAQVTSHLHQILIIHDLEYLDEEL